MIAGQTPPTFTATVTAATNNLVYQWFTNGVAIAGATTTSLPLPAVQLANNNTIIQFFATNSFGVGSNAAVTLNVSAPPTPPANSYAQAVMALNPTGYWPMHEVEPALPQLDIETNYGTLGSLGNAYYCDWQILAAGNPPVLYHQQPGALANDPNPCVVFTDLNENPSGGSGALIPNTSPLTTIKPPFTLEAWVKPDLSNTFGVILSVGNQNANNGLDGGANNGGFDWLYSGSPSTFSITMRNGNGTGQNEPKTTASYPPGQWYYLVTTYDGTNISYYINGVQDFLQNSGTVAFSPNSWSPLTISGGRWSGSLNNEFAGAIDELAVYTNLLQVADIQKHYTDGTTGAAGVYKADVLADNPLLYYRFDSPTYITPPVSTWAALTNYGLSGVQVIYQANATPGGGAGPSESGFPSTSLASDGMSIFADAVFDATFNPTGHTPISVTAWFKGNPADIAQRNWQTLVGHTDQNWRFAMNGNTGKPGFDSGNGNDVRSANPYNDGNWHQEVGTYDGTNTLVYVDGVPAGSGTSSSTIGGSTFDILLCSSPNGQSNAFGGRTFAGNMCEAAFFNGTNLSAAQISALYQAANVWPFITQQPVSTTANESSTFSNLSVVAGGSTPLYYQWYTNGVKFVGQTNAYINLSPVLTNYGGNYYVVVTNAYNSVTSATATLTIATVPRIVQDVVYTSLTLMAGGHATFAIVASGATPLHYQWTSNNTAISGATTNTYTMTNAQAGGPYNFACAVTNFLGAATSSVVAVTVISVVAPYAQAVLADKPMGFWRLDECPDNGNGNDGTIANDYWGGNDGIYTNAYICQLPGYNGNTDASEPTALFGIFAATDSDVAISNINFATPTNANAEFSVEAWVTGDTQANGGPVISKGYGGGGEEFCLDAGGNGASHDFRWFIRPVGGASAPGVVSSVGLTANSAGTWYHLVGVCDESNNLVTLYINGSSVGSTALTPGSGIVADDSYPVFIGARPSSSTVGHNDIQFIGDICQVAIYNYALNSNQVLAHYYAAGVSPYFAQQPPSSTNVNENGTLSIPTVVVGSPPLALQWIDANSHGPILGQTNATLVLANYPYASNNSGYELTASNIYSPTPVPSTPVSVTVNTGAPVIVQDLPTNIVAEVGSTISVTVIGTLPFTYTWYENGGVVSGATNNSISVPYGTNLFYVVISNSYSPAATSQTATVIGAAGTLPLTFPATGSTGWTIDNQANGPAAFTNGVLELTDNAASESRAVWCNTPQNVASPFLCQFTYEAPYDTGSPFGPADGITFCIQNEGLGADAAGGSGLGVAGISPSVDFVLNIYPGATVSAGGPGPAAGWNMNGGTNATASTSPLALFGGNPINVYIYYNGLTESAWMTNTVAHAESPVYTTNFNIASVVGANTAYVGFTAATGGAWAYQEVFDFSFATITIPKLAAQVSGTNALVSWPASTSDLFVLQKASTVRGPWVTIGSGISVSGANVQYTTPNTGADQFYRLILPIP